MPEAKGFRKRKDVRSKEPTSLGSVIDGLMAEQVFSRGMPVASLASRWTEVVGERLAAQTQPLVEYYRGWARSDPGEAPKYRVISGIGTVEEITTRALSVLASQDTVVSNPS